MDISISIYACFTSLAVSCCPAHTAYCSIVYTAMLVHWAHSINKINKNVQNCVVIFKKTLKWTCKTPKYHSQSYRVTSLSSFSLVNIYVTTDVRSLQIGIVLGDTDDTHDVSRYQIFTILVSCMPRYFLVPRYQKYRDTCDDTTHVAKPLIRYFRNFVTLKSTFRLYCWQLLLF